MSVRLNDNDSLGYWFPKVRFYLGHQESLALHVCTPQQNFILFVAGSWSRNLIWQFQLSRPQYLVHLAMCCTHIPAHKWLYQSILTMSSHNLANVVAQKRFSLIGKNTSMRCQLLQLKLDQYGSWSCFTLQWNVILKTLEANKSGIPLKS